MVRYQRIRYIPTVEDYHNSMVHQIPLNQNGPTLPPGEQPLPAPPPPEDHIGAMPGSVVINADGVVLQMGPPVPRSARIPGGAPGEAPPAGNPPAATEPAPGSDLAPEEGAGLAPEFLPGGAVNAPATNPGGPSATNPGDFPAANPGPSPDPGAPGPPRLRTRRPTPSPEPSDYDEDEEDDPELTQLEQLEQRNRELEVAVAQRDAALASAQRRLGSLEGHVAATQNTVAALRREIGGPSRPGPSAPAPTDHGGQGSEPTTNCLWCGLDGHWVPDCPKKAAGLTPEQAQLQLGTRTLVRKLKEAIAAKKAAKRPASGSGKKGGGSSRDGGGSGKRGRPGPGSGPGPVPPAAVPAIKQPMVTPPPAFLISAMKAAVPMATAKVAARWLRKGGRAVVAVISPDGSATPEPEVTPHGLPDAIKAQLDALLAEYSDVFTPLTGLPPDRPVGHTIPLEPCNRPPATPMYRLSKPEHDELKQQIQDLLSKGMIEPSSSPYAAPVLFVQKKSGELRMCIDYRQLNKITLRDQYPLPRIDDLFDKLSGCKVFSSLDLQAGYHQIRITPEDVPKTAFRTPEGHFQFKVLCFGLTNAPATFQRVMNDAFATVLGKCALVYLDDILVMSRSVQDHLLHLKQVFELLRKNKLYAKVSKWSETPVTQIETAQYPAAPAAPMGLSDQLTLGYKQDPAFTAGADHSGMYQDTDGLWRISGYRWEHVSMDLVTKLPTGTHGYDAICVIVDRLSKMVHFVPCKEAMNAMAFTRLFINNVFRLHGLPAEVLTDRGAHFNNKFWHVVKKLLGMKTNMSTAYRPQSDGQTERYNRVLEEMLRHYISPTQADWPDHLALAEFAVNNSWQESIHSTPFFLNTGQSPVTLGLRDLPDGGRCPSAHAFATWWKEGVAHARRHMADAQARYKRHADTGLKDVEFEVGAQVLLSTRNLRIKTGKVRKFVPRYVGPFVVEAKINANAYRLTLPANMSRLHPVFHVSLLKKYSGSDVGIMPPPVEWMDETPVYYVERLLDHRYVRAGKAGEFLVQWEGYDASFNTWEPRANLTGCDKLLAEYNAIHCLK
ncbi:hypothetical protein QJQ45_012260 [Haematococcus lacustris]|nr:hypothetical protein QJQ45_012260 [Haematococcus lacustris]